jgi:hypothetical protein
VSTAVIVNESNPEGRSQEMNEARPIPRNPAQVRQTGAAPR